MDDSIRRELAGTLLNWLTKELTDSENADFNAWILNQRSGDRTMWLPASQVMDVTDVTILGETLLVAFVWPLSPGPIYVYAEELEDLSELGAESWAGILIAHLDETISPGFEDQYDLMKVGSLEILVQTWG